ncbi:MAG: hybrid sensor histidine kinase/response regulator [Synechococcales cyanobacterium K44_A2020_017]|jgi:signal transduction histidine kinase|nr:hybrid sensor histidine kinase/response regulator [Synechococcales cyanobacterium K32_A2020_035]MBF2093461.1 hybrid sensor histidine kinase/response regulator [Synechococcales cyanobacterium K44_A2020_017]
MSFAESPRTPRLLAVDDTTDNLILLEAILEDEGYDIHCVTDGMSALWHVESQPPDLILLDVMMPGMDGYEVTRRIRQNPNLPFIPIVLITAHDESNLVEGLDLGADDFVRKPVNPDELLARVRSLLRLKRSIDLQTQMAKRQEDFVMRLTHDLRTPLVAADRMLHLFQKETFCPISPDMQEAIAVMIRSNDSLLQMVNTLLEVYRYDAGYKTLTFSICDLRNIIQEVMGELQPIANEKQLHLVFETDDHASDVSAKVRGDRLELRRVFTNLIGNALKFTSQGQVVVRLVEQPMSTEQTEEQLPPCVKVEVQDTGPGISPDDQQMIFERFRQGKGKRSGSGLGLYLSRRILEAHQGQISVVSEPGRGSVFSIQLPGVLPEATPSSRVYQSRYH